MVITYTFIIVLPTGRVCTCLLVPTSGLLTEGQKAWTPVASYSPNKQSSQLSCTPVEPVLEGQHFNPHGSSGAI
jgi:hypothetical protein